MAKKPMKKRNALGRGLGALLEDSPARESTEKQFEAPSNVGSINEIKVEHIETNPFQPRTHFDQTALQELSDSISVYDPNKWMSKCHKYQNSSRRSHFNNI